MTYLRTTILKDYVIRIYRRGKNDPRILVGVVKEVGVEGNKALSKVDELWSILNLSKAETTRTKKRNNSSTHKNSPFFFIKR